MRLNKTAVITVLMLLSFSFNAAAGPLRDAISNATLPAAPPAATHANKAMVWAGVAMLSAGATLAVLSTTALKRETCAVVSIGYSIVGGCVEETNKALLWSGIGIAGGGAVISIFGARQHATQLAFAPGRATLQQRFSF